MPISKAAMRNAIAGYRKQGLGDNQIIGALARRKDEVGSTFNAIVENFGGYNEIAQEFGLKIGMPKGSKTVSDKPNNNATLSDKVKAVGKSAAMGLADTGAGIVQGGAYLADNVLGTHLLDDYNKSYQSANAVTSAARQQAGFDGVDLARTGTNIAATLPFFMAGGGATLGARMAGQAAIGAGVGAAGYADNAKSRLANITGGAIGGAAGQLGGELAGKAITKGYNAVKGNKKAAAGAVEDLAKQYGVRVSAGDASRGNITKNFETQLERVPVVGMGKFRAAQQTEAKAAASKVTDDLSTAMNSTEFKDLPKLQQAAANGDRNAARISSIVAKADTPDKVLQASLEMRKWREGQIASKLYDKVGHEIGKVTNATVTPTKTLRKIDSKLASESASLAPDDALVRDLSNIKSKLEDPTISTDFNNMRLLRSQLGDLTEKYMKGSNPNKSAAKFFGDLRQSVENDIGDFVQSSGNPAIQTAYKRADGYYKGMIARQDKAFAQAMDSNKPDEIYSAFIKTGKGDRAANFYNALDPKGQAALRFKMADEAVSKATNESTGAFSPARFAGEFERLNEPYSQVFKGQDKAQMDGFVKLMRHVERAGQYAENPPTGVRLTDLAMVGGAATAPVITAKVGGAALMAKTLFTTAAGKRLLLAANELPPESRAMANILKIAEKMASSSAANSGGRQNKPQF